jgi:hypothetical protein
LIMITKLEKEAIQIFAKRETISIDRYSTTRDGMLQEKSVEMTGRADCNERERVYQ